jgi:hypothetical protein
VNLLILTLSTIISLFLPVYIFATKAQLIFIFAYNNKMLPHESYDANRNQADGDEGHS